MELDSIFQSLVRRGVTRRRFLEFCGMMTATLALPPRYQAQVVQALEQKRKPVVVWLEFQDCAGNTEALLRSSHPDVADLVLDVLSLEYHETLMAGAGHQAEAALQRVLKEEKGKYIVIVEGSIPTADDGVYCVVGGRAAIDTVREVCKDAALAISVGSCAWDGGLVRSNPNPTGALGLPDVVSGVKVINLPGCPHNPANTAATLVHYITFGQMPALDDYNRPLFAYGKLIHNQCERRAHFDSGRFVQEWGDEGHRKGYCLYKMGCKGPESTYNCPTVRFNEGTSWPVKAGHGCIGCASPRFWDTRSPFYERVPHFAGFGVDVPVGNLGVAVVGGVAAGVAVHAAIASVKHKGKVEEKPEKIAGQAGGEEK